MSVIWGELLKMVEGEQKKGLEITHSTDFRAAHSSFM